ncbi:MAG: hypothetical protein KF745_05365 [Phycisphaeraceae bacterium]|nr:hypothetical protein [Phycisphaeraceae bacterium]
MFELRPITRESIPRALAKAERYRLLDEPMEAESICRDVLAIDAGNTEAVQCLLLALTDQFNGHTARPEEARGLAGRLGSPYERAYFAGVVEERWAKAMLQSGYPLTSVFTQLTAAMEHFEGARRLAPSENDDAVLRWNTCVRIIERHGLRAAEEDAGHGEVSLDDDVPLR